MVILWLALTISQQPAVGQNIVVVMVDDLDMKTARALYVGGWVPTIESVFSNGTIFTESFVTTALCCPSRATFLTGQYSHNHGVLGNIPPSGGVEPFNDFSTLATALDQAGYYVGHVGKYLNGYGTVPGGDGALDPLYIPPGYDWWAGLVANPQPMYDYEINLNGELVQFGSLASDYQTDVLAALATSFIGSAGRPFFLIVTPAAPHVEPGYELPGCSDPWRNSIRPAPRHLGILDGAVIPRSPAFNEADLSDKPPAIQSLSRMRNQDIACNDQIARDQAESMLAVDDLVAELVAAITATGELNDTIFIFTSDNGYFHGEHRLTQKVFAYDEGIRVPLVIARPGDSTRRIVTDYVLNNDLAPTVAELAGTQMGHAVDGRSLVPLLDGQPIAWRTRFLVEFLGSVQKWPGLPNFQVARSRDYYYAEWSDGALELYDLELDPHQLRSVHTEASYDSVLADMQQKLTDLSTCAGVQCVQAED